MWKTIAQLQLAAISDKTEELFQRLQNHDAHIETVCAISFRHVKPLIAFPARRCTRPTTWQHFWNG